MSLATLSPVIPGFKHERGFLSALSTIMRKLIFLAAGFCLPVLFGAADPGGAAKTGGRMQAEIRGVLSQNLSPMPVGGQGIVISADHLTFQVDLPDQGKISESARALLGRPVVLKGT